MNQLTREQKMLGAAGANVLFIISLFLPWFGAGGFNVGGDDVIPSWWILLIFAAVAAVVLAADALNFELPAAVDPVTWGLYLSSVPAIVTIMIFLEGAGGGGRKFGLFMGLVFSIVATVGAFLARREER